MTNALPPFEAHFAEGVDHFNAGRFWEAHESWETLWLVSATEMRPFLQGLIQLAAAYLHLGRANYSGAKRLYDAALGRLDAFPNGYCGVELASLIRKAGLDREGAAMALASGEHLNRIPYTSAPPRLALAENWQSLIPRGGRW